MTEVNAPTRCEADGTNLEDYERKKQRVTDVSTDATMKKGEPAHE